MKLLFISPRYSGGIGGHAFRVAKKLRKVGFEVELMNVPHIPIKKLKNPTFSLFGISKALMKKESYDVVHAFNVPSAFIMKYIKAKKKVLSVHGVYSEQVGLLHSSILASIISSKEKQVLQWADVLTTDSKKVQLDYKEKLNLDVTHLPGPLDVKEFDDIPDVKKNRNQVLYLGRDSYEKGIDILKNIEKKIHGNVIYCTNTPWKKAMIELKKSALLVVPSRIESLPQTIREAYFLKTPVIATNVGGVPELVENNVTGILIPPNDPHELIKTVNSLLEDPPKAHILCENAFKFVVDNYSWESLLPKYVEFYENLVR